MAQIQDELIDREAVSASKTWPFLKEFRQKAADLSRVDPKRSLPPLVFDWSVIAVAIFLSERAQSLWMTVPALLVIAARQHALLVLVHEGAHGRLLPSRAMNDFVSNLFAAYPNFFCTESYRSHHALHHRFLNTEKDPDWARKLPRPEWQFPQGGATMVKSLIRVALLSWVQLSLLFWMFFGLSSLSQWKNPERRQLILRKLVFYAASLTVIGGLGVWRDVAFYWLLPYFCLMPLMERMRSVSEHFGLPRAHLLNQTRNMMAHPVERFFFGPHHINYHLIHHLYPTVPQYALPQLRRELMKNPDFSQAAHENSSYLFFGSSPLLNDLQRPSDAAKEAQDKGFQRAAGE